MTELLAKITEGDELAFRQLYHHYFDRLFKFACSYLQLEEEAEEVVSDVFLNIWLQKQHLAKVNNISTYLYTAIRNTALNYLKKRNATNLLYKTQYIKAALTATALMPDDVLITKENEMEIERAVNYLPPVCKMIFKLVREDGLKYKDVAEILDISVNTVNVQMSIAVKKITKHIKVKRKANIPI
jgi:RNA polymerase sigma-70 factor (family 1)